MPLFTIVIAVKLMTETPPTRRALPARAGDDAVATDRSANRQGRWTISAARRRLAIEALGITLSAGGFGLVYGLSTRHADFSVAEALAMSLFVLGGASQFAAVGLVAQGTPWPAIVLLTALLNARHLLYSAALSPWLRAAPLAQRAVMAHTLTDETFALSLAHFRRLGRADIPGYWIASGFVCLPWIMATALGVLGGEAIPDPASLGLDVVFPAAMAGLGVALVEGRRELVAAVVGAAVAVAVGLAMHPAVGIVAGGLLGPLAGLVIPGAAGAAEVSVALPRSQLPSERSGIPAASRRGSVERLK